MKKILAIILAIVLVVAAFPVSSFAFGSTTYYIDSVDGNDANSGTSQASPWKTVANIPAIQLEAGDSILFKCGGVYYSTLTLTCSGSEGNPITISSYGTGEKPLLTTDVKSEVLRLFDCSYVTVSNLEITAHNGGGIWIDTPTRTSDGIKLLNLTMHDMQNMNWHGRDSLSAGAAQARACVMVKGLPARSRYAVNNLTIKDCEMYDCGNGISLWGSWNDKNDSWNKYEEDIDPIFNENALVENVYFHDMAAESIIVGICKNALVTHCRSINCCQDKGVDENGNVVFYNASMWFWGSAYSTIEYTEISGQKNVGDGMAVDFDSYSHHCTYQYIYSHDNNCFMCNCPNYSGQHDNTVRYCLSVNDNNIRSRFGGDSGEYNFRFYNNTMYNIGDFNFGNLHDSFVVNNIFVPKDGCSINSAIEDLFRLKKLNNTYRNNCYYNCVTPIIDRNSINAVPGFAGTDTTDPDSFRLSSDSKLIGAGSNADSIYTLDFYGNTNVSHNIGCYTGAGVDNTDTQVRENIFQKIIRFFKSLYSLIKK